jgi:hypothetical protein
LPYRFLFQYFRRFALLAVSLGSLFFCSFFSLLGHVPPSISKVAPPGGISSTTDLAFGEIIAFRSLTFPDRTGAPSSISSGRADAGR